MNRIRRFNDCLGIIVTKAVGTMWCAYAFAALALVSLPDAVRAGVPALIQWTAQTFIQLVLLSIIIVGQDIGSRKINALIEDTHTVVLNEMALIRDLVKELHAKEEV